MNTWNRPCALLVLFVCPLAANAEPPPPESMPPESPGILRATFTGHTEAILCVAVAADGKVIASGGTDKTARLWDTTTGRATHVLQHSGAVRCLAFSEDGTKVAAGDADALVLVWDVGSGKKLAALKGVGGPISQVGFTANGKGVAAVSPVGRGKLWDLGSGEARTELDSGTPNGFHRFAISPDGKTLATSSSTQHLQLWDLTTGKVRFAPEGHTGSLNALAFDPQVKLLATGGTKDKFIKLWDVATGKEQATLVGHQKGIYFLVFSPDGKSLLATDFDGSMKLWDVEKRQVKATLGKVQIGDRLQGTPRGWWSISADLKSWAVGAGKEVRCYDITEFTAPKK